MPCINENYTKLPTDTTPASTMSPRKFIQEIFLREIKTYRI